MRRSTVILAVLLAIAVAFAIVAITTPTSSGGSATYTRLGPVHTTSQRVVSLRTWKRKGQVRHIGHHVTVTRTKLRSRALSGPCYRIDAEVHGDSALIDKVVQGLASFKLCMQARDHAKVLDKYTSGSYSHRETWLWWLGSIQTVKGQGVSTKWCNGGVGPCSPVEYRYWRYTFQWKDGVSIFGQDFAHHKTLYIGCTLRAGAGGFHCGTGEA